MNAPGEWPGGDLLVLRAGSAQLDVALLGATPLRWLVPWRGELVDILDGYADAPEMQSQDGVRNGIMAPFCNRIADGRYLFDGAEHDLLPGRADRTIYHGLVRTEPFALVDANEGAEASVALLRCTTLASGTAPGYPFHVVVDVVYRLTPARLEMEVTGSNVGDRAAPFASGWHPYFRLPGAETVDRYHLDVPSAFAVATDDALLPLAGAAAFRPHDGARWRPIGDSVVDAAFGGLRLEDGEAATTLTDPETGARLTLHQPRGVVHVFTGDTLARDRRGSIAVEPAEAMTDAFNRPEYASALRLEPGASRTFAFAVTGDWLEGTG